MRSRSETWQRIVASGDFQIETTVRIYGAFGSDPSAISGSDSRGAYREYNTITAPVISRRLISGDNINVGECCAGTLTFSILTTDTIPRSAMIVVRGRVYDDTEYAEWKEFGTYWVDTRISEDDLTSIVAYDAMKRGNQAYSDTSQSMSWPKTIATVLTRIGEQIGISYDPRTVSAILNSEIGSKNIIVKPNDSETLLDVLGHIAGVLGGNWTVTDDNKLRFVSLVPVPLDEDGCIIDNDGNCIIDNSSNYIIWAEKSDDSGGQNVGGGEAFNVPVVIGSLESSTNYTISKVTASLDEEHKYSSGDNSGVEIVVEHNPYMIEPMFHYLYRNIAGMDFQPFEITDACYDPAVELGDGAFIGDSVRSVIYAETRRFDVCFRVDASAPGEAEVDNEYPFISASEKTKYELTEKVNQTERELHSEIVQTQTSILTTVSENYTTKSESAEIRSEISQTADEINIEVAKKVGKDSVIASINASTEREGGSAVTISADKINIQGVLVASGWSDTENDQTVINGSKIKTGTIAITKLGSDVTDSIADAKNTANGANAREQYIYISEPTLTTAVAANTTWVTDSTGNQNTWSTRRPEFDGDYPVLFVAKQSQTVQQFTSGATCTCTTPVIDNTTTVIDGGNIITGTVTANQIAVGTITGDKIASNTITAAKIDATNLHVSSVNVDGSLSASKIEGGVLTLGGNNDVKGKLVINDASGYPIGSWNSSGLIIDKGKISGTDIKLGSLNNGGSIELKSKLLTNDSYLNNIESQYIRIAKNDTTRFTLDPDSLRFQAKVSGSWTNNTWYADGEIKFRGQQCCIEIGSTYTTINTNAAGTGTHISLSPDWAEIKCGTAILGIADKEIYIDDGTGARVTAYSNTTGQYCKMLTGDDTTDPRVLTFIEGNKKSSELLSGSGTTAPRIMAYNDNSGKYCDIITGSGTASPRIGLVNTSANDYIYAYVRSSTNPGIVINKNDNAVYTYGILAPQGNLNAQSNVSVLGNLTCDGTKSRVVNTNQFSRRLLYCYETPTPTFGDIGEGRIADDGNCYIWFDSVFAQVITTNQYQVFIQPYSDGDCYVSERTGTHFVVCGTPGMSFGWEIKAKQRDYDELRLEKEDDEFVIESQDYGEYAASHIEDLRKERDVA